MTRVQAHALVGFLLVFVLVVALTLRQTDPALSAFEAVALPLVGALVGALVGLGEWVGQIATLDAVRAIKRGDVDHDDVDEG